MQLLRFPSDRLNNKCRLVRPRKNDSPKSITGRLRFSGAEKEEEEQTKELPEFLFIF